MLIFIHISMIHLVTTSIISRNIFGFLVSDHFFENYHARRLAFRSGGGWISALKTPIFVVLRVYKHFFVYNISGQINP